MIDLGLDRKIELALFGAPVDAPNPTSANDVAALDKTFSQADTAKDPWREIARGVGWENTWSLGLGQAPVLTLRFLDVDWEADAVEHFARIGSFPFAIVQFGKCFYARNARIVECHTDKHNLSRLVIVVTGVSSVIQ